MKLWRMIGFMLTFGLVSVDVANCGRLAYEARRNSRSAHLRQHDRPYIPQMVIVICSIKSSAVTSSLPSSVTPTHASTPFLPSFLHFHFASFAHAFLVEAARQLTTAGSAVLDLLLHETRKCGRSSIIERSEERRVGKECPV